MRIREYRSTDRKTVINAIRELEGLMHDMDPLKRALSRKDFPATKYVRGVFRRVEKNKGKIFIAEDGDRFAGCIIGMIDDDHDKPPLEKYPTRDGRILELIVDAQYRSKGVGKALMTAMEKYFLAQKCETIHTDCFGPNKNAHAFYHKLGYVDRAFFLMKKL